MSIAGHFHGLTATRERLTLLTLAALPFSQVRDFMTITPVGARFSPPIELQQAARAGAHEALPAPLAREAAV